MNYKNIKSIEYHCNCTNISSDYWHELMAGAKKANKKEINNLIKKFLPRFYYELTLNLTNPFNYYKTKKHLILVHSSIEYFFEYNN